MPITQTDTDFMARVMATLTNNPTAAELDFLIQAHTRIGYLAGVAESEAEMQYAIRKHEEANAYRNIMNGPEKVTAAAAERLAELEVWELRKAEIDAKSRATKIKNLLNSVTECINGIKFLGRMGV